MEWANGGNAVQQAEEDDYLVIGEGNQLVNIGAVEGDGTIGDNGGDSLGLDRPDEAGYGEEGKGSLLKNLSESVPFSPDIFHRRLL